MAFAYWIVPAKRLVVVRGSGVVADQETLSLRRALGNDTRFASDLCELADYREVTDFVLSSLTLRILGAINPYGARSRRALVAPTDLVYGMMRMWQLRRAPESADHVEVFREMKDALEWLGIVEADLPDGEPDFVVPT